MTASTKRTRPFRTHRIQQSILLPHELGQLPGREELRMRGKMDGTCDTHAWETEGIALRLEQAMRDRYPKGINVCRECIDRALEDAKASKSHGSA